MHAPGGWRACSSMPPTCATRDGKLTIAKAIEVLEKREALEKRLEEESGHVLGRLPRAAASRESTAWRPG